MVASVWFVEMCFRDSSLAQVLWYYCSFQGRVLLATMRVLGNENRAASFCFERVPTKHIEVSYKYDTNVRRIC